MTRLPGLLLAAGGLLLAAAIALPWGHPRNHLSEIRKAAEPARDYAADGMWIEAAYLAGQAVLFAAPAAFGAALLLAAVLPPGRVAAAAALAIAGPALAAAAALAWIALALNDEPRYAPYLLLGGGLLTVVLLVEIAAGASALRGRWPSDAVQLPPLGLLFLAGLGLAAALWNDPAWHVQGYLAMAAGAGLGLLGIALRRRRGRREAA